VLIVKRVLNQLSPLLETIFIRNTQISLDYKKVRRTRKQRQMIIILTKEHKKNNKNQIPVKTQEPNTSKNKQVSSAQSFIKAALLDCSRAMFFKSSPN